MGGITLVLVLILAVLSSVHGTKTVIYVDSSSQTGVDDSCRKESNSIHCLSFNQALKEAQQFSNSIDIFLQPGQHKLHNGRETQLRNISQLAIVGNTSSEGEVVIKCLSLAGLSFLRSSNITMNNLKIVGCGALQNSHASDIISSNIQSAVFVDTCNIVRFINIDIIDSNGTGIVLYNPSGVVLLDMCNFINNSLSSVESPIIGGGGLVIEANDVTINFNSTIVNSTFTNNAAKNRRFYRATSPSKYLGLGGGISLLFRGGAANSTVILKEVCLQNNMAQFGGGLFLDFHDSANGNNVTIDGIVVTNNNAALEVGLLLPFASGGGIAIVFAASQVEYPFNNEVEINNGNFVSNTAQLGGGIAVDVVYDAYGCVNADNKLLIENCDFFDNQESSAHFLGTSNGCRSLLNTTLSFCSFTYGHCRIQPYSWSCLYSTVLLNLFQLSLKGSLLFSDNIQSALGLTASSIELLPSAQLMFTNNRGRNGAALHIVDCSSVIVNDNTSLYFENNKAVFSGGAIYSEACTQTKRDCFIRHSNSTLGPDQWKTIFTFINNYASLVENSIFVDSLQSCVWPNYNKSTTFCWDGWSYGTENCQNQLRSGPAYISNNGHTKYTIYPGECINLRDFTVFDDFGNIITFDTDYLQVDVLSGNVHTTRYNEPNCRCNYPIAINCIYDYDDNSLNRSCDDGEVAIQSKDCNSDYASQASQILIHPAHRSYGILLDLSFKTCNNGSSCVSLSNSYGSCFKFYSSIPYEAVCNEFRNTNNHSNFDCIGERICGSCRATSDRDIGMIINVPVFNCISCENDYVGVVYFLIQILLVMIMMTVLAVLHINITNGNLNAYILYSQMVTLQLPRYGYTTWLPNVDYVIYFPDTRNFTIPLIVYSIWNLNFLTLFPDPFCIPGIRTAVGVILLQYVIAACPLLFIIVTYTWIQCYNNGYRLVVYTTRPVHRLLARFWQKFKIQPSLIDTYAGLLLLAYMRFLAVSVKLLMFITFASSQDVALVPLVIIPILCLLVFVILPMAVLLLYPLKIFQRCLTCCRLDRPGLHAVIDAYQGCFKNSATDGSECRYFAGLYLFFRFCYVAVLVFSLSLGLDQDHLLHTVLPLSGACLSFVMAGLVLILRPYKNPAHNIIDFLILCLMTLFAALSATYALGIDYDDIFVFLGPLYLPFVCLVIYLIFCLFKCCCYACVTQNAFCKVSRNNENTPSTSERQPLLVPPTKTVVGLGDYAEDNGYPDCIVNPAMYT